MALRRSNPTHYRWEILKKEIDLIDGTIRNLDDIIMKTRNFAWLMWGGSLFLIVGALKGDNVNQKLLIFCTAVIPLLFWAMDYQWRKHLRFASEREKIISKFINSEHFLSIMEDEGKAKFPVLDPVGWIYTTQSKDEQVIALKEGSQIADYFMNRKIFSFWDIAFYKDAKIYFLTMIAISIVFGFLYN